MENHSLETEEGMHCSWCGKLLPFCECPASLARSIDKERAEAIRERNELREQLLAARREVEAKGAELVALAAKLVTQSDESLARYNRLRERCEGYKLKAARAFADGLEAAAKIVCPEPHAEEERDCADIARQIRALAATPERT